MQTTFGCIVEATQNLLLAHRASLLDAIAPGHMRPKAAASVRAPVLRRRIFQAVASSGRVSVSQKPQSTEKRVITII